MKRTQGLCTKSTVQLCCPSCEEHYVSSLVWSISHQIFSIILYFTCSLILYRIK